MTHPTALPGAAGSSRRNFLALAGAGVAAAAAAAVAVHPTGTGASAIGGAVDEQVLEVPAGAVAMLAHVKDVRTGEIAVMMDGHEVVLTDRALVAKLAHAVAAHRP